MNSVLPSDCDSSGSAWLPCVIVLEDGPVGGDEVRKVGPSFMYNRDPREPLAPPPCENSDKLILQNCERYMLLFLRHLVEDF